MNLQDVIENHAKNKYAWTQSPELGPARWWLITTERDDESLRGSGDCHANLRYLMGRHNQETPLAVISGSDPQFADQEGVVKFYDWLINASVFKDFLPVKDAKLNLTNGFVIDCEIPQKMMLPLLQLLRLPTSEFKRSLQAMGKLIEAKSKFSYLNLVLLTCGLRLELEGDTVVVREPNTYFSRYYLYHGGHLPFSTVINEGYFRHLQEGVTLFETDYNHVGSPVSVIKDYLNMGSNQIFSPREPRSNTTLSSKNYGITAVNNAFSGIPTLFTKTERVKGEVYDNFWEEATHDFKAIFASKTSGNGKAINWFAFEETLLNGVLRNA